MTTTNAPTYCGTYEDDQRILFAGFPRGPLLGRLSLLPCPTERGGSGTLDRADGGDPFERARFVSTTGRVIVIEREPGVSSTLSSDTAPRTDLDERRDVLAYLRGFVETRTMAGMADAYSDAIAHGVGVLVEAIEAGEHVAAASAPRG